MQHRAIIAPRLAFLRHVSSGWVSDYQNQLLGTEAPDNLGQATVDLALSWGQPDAWLLEHFRVQVHDAVGRGVTHALDHVLIAMLWQAPGYSPEEVSAFLRQAGQISQAGEALGHLLRGEDTTTNHVAVAVEFWERAIAFKDSDSLAGFGWYAEIAALDDVVWISLMRQSLAVARGQISWARHVAKRAARPEPSADTLEILNLLVRGLRDSWDHREIIGIARDVIKGADSLLGETAEYQCLRTTLLERGVQLLEIEDAPETD